jgi:spore germination cell wall hydrolase CwlJ-like protein
MRRQTMASIISLILSLSIVINTLGAIKGDDIEDNGKRYSMDRVWYSMSEEQRATAPVELKAQAVGLTVDEFILFSKTVEAESNRSSDDLIGRTLIALTIYNRVESPSFPDTITGVITDSGQFEVYEIGAVYSVSNTILSDQAILEAHSWLCEGDSPDILYFNNSNYYGEAYGYYGGNYFSFGYGG